MPETNEPNRAKLVEALRLLGEVYATQVAIFQQGAATKIGLGVTDIKALSILLREGPQSAGALMRQLNLTSGAVTGVIERLRRRHLVRRQIDPADRRRAIISADTEALAEAPNPYLGIGAAFDQLHERYSSDQLVFLTQYLEAATRITIEQAAELGD